jgi:hypothetical protein
MKGEVTIMEGLWVITQSFEVCYNLMHGELDRNLLS